MRSALHAAQNFCYISLSISFNYKACFRSACFGKIKLELRQAFFQTGLVCIFCNLSLLLFFKASFVSIFRMLSYQLLLNLLHLHRKVNIYLFISHVLNVYFYWNLPKLFINLFITDCNSCELFSNVSLKTYCNMRHGNAIVVISYYYLLELENSKVLLFSKRIMLDVQF